MVGRKHNFEKVLIQDKVPSFFVSLELFIPFYYIVGMYTTETTVGHG